MSHRSQLTGLALAVPAGMVAVYGLIVLILLRARTSSVTGKGAVSARGLPTH